MSPVEIAKQAVDKAKEEHQDYVLIDTAGRLHIDEELMDELQAIKETVNPDEILLSRRCHDRTGCGQCGIRVLMNSSVLPVLILTKLDGDTRGGAALSIRAVTEKPIKFVGMGEKMDALEPFHPERMASRILGMGDVLTLIEKAEQAVERGKGRELEQKMRTASFTLEDFLEQLRQVRKMGPLDELLGMLPGCQ